MLDCSPLNLTREGDAAMLFTKEHCDSMDAQLRRYVGPYFRSISGWAADDFDSENHAFEFISLEVAQNVAENPTWDVSSRRGPEEAADAEAMGLSLDRWSRDIDLRTTLRQLFVDFCFKYAAATVSQVPVPGSDEGEQTSVPNRPQVKRLSPRRVFRDPLALNADDCRYTGHQTIRDKADLVAQAKAEPGKWYLEAIEALPINTGINEMRGVKEQSKVPDRHEVVVRQFWVPEVTLPDDDPAWGKPGDDGYEKPGPQRAKLYHGTIYTLGIGCAGQSNEKTDFIMPPRPYFGPRWGPYVIGDYLYVPDQVHGLSQFTAVEGQVRELNNVARAMRRGMDARKNIGVVSSKDSAASDAIKVTGDGEVAVLNVDDVRTAVGQLALGGTDEMMMAYRQIVRDVLQQGSGLSDARSGSTRPGVTATADTLAASGGEARSAGSTQQWLSFVQKLGRTSAWFMHHDGSYVASLGNGNKFYGGPPDEHGDEIRAALSQMGVPPEEQADLIAMAQKRYEAQDFDDMEFKIEPMSMQRPSEAKNQQVAAVVIPLVIQVITVAAQNPAFNPEPSLSMIGKAFGCPEVVRSLSAQGMAAMQQLNAQALAAQGAPQSDQGTKPPVRMTQDVQPRAAPGGPTGTGDPKRASVPGQSSGAKAPKMAKTAY